jgi:CubicO group peptidase (beta-lactamase class C family)
MSNIRTRKYWTHELAHELALAAFVVTMVSTPTTVLASPAPQPPIQETDPRRVLVSGLAEPNLENIDRSLQNFVARHRIPGLSVAITYQRRLLYAKGFGYADLETRQPVRPDSLFRIASLSKPITAVAVLQLAEEGKFKLDDRVVNVLHLEPTRDPRIANVTIRHLLQHRGGWDRGKSYDPMFIHQRIARQLKIRPPANPAQIIQYMMGQPLDFEPGSAYAYSNFGYRVLGRVIEKVSGQPYEEYVRQRVLKPIGVRDMRLGRSLIEDRAPREVRYYDEKGRMSRGVVGYAAERAVPLPYGVDAIEAMDAHGGWIASAVDMVRFCSTFDDPGTFRLLRPASIATMLGRPPGAAGHVRARAGDVPKNHYYGCGWDVRPQEHGAYTFWHTGALPGTSTLMVHRFDGFDWVVLCNTRSSVVGNDIAGLIDPEMHAIVDRVTLWPRGNLFPKLLSGNQQDATAPKRSP